MELGMIPFHRRPIARWIGFAAGIAVLIGVAVGIIVAQPWADGSVHPVQSVRYLGVHVPDAPFSYYGVEQFAQAIGTQPNIVSYYSPWLEKFQVDFATLAMGHGALTLIQMDPTNVPLARIATGGYDTYLRSFATEVKVFGAQIALSFGHEMNGNWYSWGYQHTSPKVFVAAWRHIVTVFRSVGAGNVIWLWTVNVLNNSVQTLIPDPTPWWPGNSYVTWIGIDGYYYNSSTMFTSLFGPTIVAVRKLTSDPILIAETGAAVSAGQSAKISDLFDGIRTFGLLGFIWFDENTQGRAWRINSRQAFDAFRQNAKAFLKPVATPPTTRPSPFGSPPLIAASSLLMGR
jgi:mannan endo-1,4-beta-mannosidase